MQMSTQLTTSIKKNPWIRSPWLVALVMVAAWAFMGAQTLINLTEQVSGYLPAANGGTGRGTLTAHYTIVGNGTGQVSMIAPSTSGYCYLSGGASADPAFGACPGPPNFADGEVPTGAINGSNQSFTLAHTPTSGSLKLFLNGQ